MSQHTTRRTGSVLVLLLTLAALVVAAPAAEATARAGRSAAASATASVTLVHGVRGLLADVVVDGATVLKGFAYERASSPLALPAGTHRVQVFRAGEPHTTALLDVKLAVKANQFLTAAVGFDNKGQPKAYVFDDALPGARHSASSIVVRNVSQGQAPQVLIDGHSATSHLAAGRQLVQGVRPGRHTVGLKVDGAWLLTNQPVRASAGHAMVVYVVGLQSAKSVALVANSVTPRFSASGVDSGGLAPTEQHPLLPSWLSLALLSSGTATLLLLVLARRRTSPPVLAAAGAADPR